MKSTIGLFYEGSRSQPVSYVYQEGRDLLNDDSRDNALIYVPSNQSEITLVDNGTTPEAQWAALDLYFRQGTALLLLLGLNGFDGDG